MARRISFFLLFSFPAVLQLSFAETSTPDFAREVLPILSDKCFVCHGPDAKEDEVRLDSFAGATVDLGGYRAIEPEKLEDSEIIHRIFDEEDPMPPTKAEAQLTDAEREILKRWVMSGGKYEQHWAFVPPVKVDGVSSIDEFVRKKLNEAELSPSGSADAETLARRVALTLTGLPPEPMQLDRFLKSGNYEALVDELLGSSRFGEQQARYWLDAVRYGDTHGLHLDNKRGIFPYRDWVVKAFNDNLSFDQFITWQLAGDLLESPTLEQLTATGYVRLNPSTAEGGVIPAEFQAKNNFDRTENFGTVFLGMTLNCARCHTHKYDPITHQEYFELFAFFNSTAENPLDGNKYEYPPVARVPSTMEGWKNWRVLEEERRALLPRIAEAVTADVFGKVTEHAAKPREGKSFWDQVKGKKGWADLPENLRLRVAADQEMQLLADASLREAAAGLITRIDEAERSFTTTLVAKDLPKPRETRILERGEYSSPIGESLSPNVFTVMNSFPEGAPPNRLGLAQWLLASNNPLTSRVLVNRFWQKVFGEGLVRSPEDFGLQGKYPTHPELLDWLAVTFQESGWDYKALIKQMVMSETFRQDSGRRKGVSDPDNLLLARGPSYRLDAEVIRDIGLWASGLLREDMGGEGVKPYQPEGMWIALAHPASNTKKYVPDEKEAVFRRSLYVYWKRTSPHPMMTLFDAPSRESSCVRRSRGNTPLQSLGLLNEPQRVAMSRAMAARLVDAHSDEVGRIDAAFRWLACRAPTEVESSACQSLLEKARDRYKADPKAAGAMAGVTSEIESERVLDLAAWTQLCATLLASDTAILLY